MFFKNATIYRIRPDWNIHSEALAEAMAPFKFTPTGSLDMQHVGWASPRDDDQLIYSMQRQFLLRLRVERKVMPASAIDLVVSERARDVEEEQGHKPGRKQRREIKERVIDEMLPHAFRQQRDTWVWMDLARKLLIVDSATPSVCDAVIGLLAKTLGGENFPLEGLHVACAPAAAMTNWLAADEAPDGFTIDTQAELHSSGDSNGVIALKNQPIDATDVGRYIREGKQCVLLALTWSDRVSFVLTDGLALKRICPLDILTSSVDRKARTDDEEFEADFVLMTGELSRLIADLIHALGGEKLDLAQQATEFTAETDAAGHIVHISSRTPDTLLDTATALVRESGRASISFIQRHLRIGYNRAASLFEQMEQSGVVTPMRADGTREVIGA